MREVVGFAPYERRVLELLRNSKVCILPYGRSRLARSHRVRLVQDKKARKLTKKRVLHSLPSHLSTPCIKWALIELFFLSPALSSSAPFSVQNASWRNSRVSSRRAGGRVTRRIHPAGSFDYARMRICVSRDNRKSLYAFIHQFDRLLALRTFCHLFESAKPRASKQSK